MKPFMSTKPRYSILLGVREREASTCIPSAIQTLSRILPLGAPLDHDVPSLSFSLSLSLSLFVYLFTCKNTLTILGEFVFVISPHVRV